MAALAEVPWPFPALLLSPSEAPALQALDSSAQHLWDAHGSVTGNWSERRGGLENKLLRSRKHPLLAHPHWFWWSCAKVELGTGVFQVIILSLIICWSVSKA